MLFERFAPWLRRFGGDDAARGQQLARSGDVGCAPLRLRLGQRPESVVRAPRGLRPRPVIIGEQLRESGQRVVDLAQPGVVVAPAPEGLPPAQGLDRDHPQGVDVGHDAHVLRTDGLLGRAIRVPAEHAGLRGLATLHLDMTGPALVEADELGPEVEVRPPFPVHRLQCIHDAREHGAGEVTGSGAARSMRSRTELKSPPSAPRPTHQPSALPSRRALMRIPPPDVGRPASDPRTPRPAPSGAEVGSGRRSRERTAPRAGSSPTRRRRPHGARGWSSRSTRR